MTTERNTSKTLIKLCDPDKTPDWDDAYEGISSLIPEIQALEYQLKEYKARVKTLERDRKGIVVALRMLKYPERKG